jgi:hypothetical protein
MRDKKRKSAAPGSEPPVVESAEHFLTEWR